MLKRLANYSKWIYKEFVKGSSPKGVYDMLAKDNMYDGIVDFKKRTLHLSTALSQVTNAYTNVLDLACGTGAMIEAIPSKETKKIIGVDISSGLLEIARNRFKKYRNIIFKSQNFMHLSFPPNSFDLITMSYATRYVLRHQEKEFALKASKFLKRNGTFLAVLIEAPEQYIFKLFEKKLSRMQNADMNHEKYIISVLGKHLKYEKTISLGIQLLLYKSKAIYFRKQ